MTHQILESVISVMTDEELIQELAAVYNQMKVVKENEEADSEVMQAKEDLLLAKGPYATRLGYLKKYAKAIFAVCRLREIRLNIKEMV